MNNNKGVVMLLVVGFIFMLLILGGTLMMIAVSHFRTSYHQLARTKAYYTAEAVMQHALWTCRVGLHDLSSIDPLPAGPTPETYGGETINGIDGSDVEIRIYALIDYLPGVHRVDVTVEY